MVVSTISFSVCVTVPLAPSVFSTVVPTGVSVGMPSSVPGVAFGASVVAGVLLAGALLAGVTVVFAGVASTRVIELSEIQPEVFEVSGTA